MNTCRKVPAFAVSVLVSVLVVGCGGTGSEPVGSATVGSAASTTSLRASFTAVFGKPLAVNEFTFDSFAQIARSNDLLVVRAKMNRVYAAHVIAGDNDRVLIIGIDLDVLDVFKGGGVKAGDTVRLLIPGPGTLPGTTPDDEAALKVTREAWGQLGECIAVLDPLDEGKGDPEYNLASTQTLFAERAGKVFSPNYPDGDDPLAAEAAQYTSLKQLGTALSSAD